MSADKTIFACVFGGMIRSTDDAKTWELLTDMELYDDERDPWILRGSWVAAYNIRHLGYGVHRCKKAIFGKPSQAANACQQAMDARHVEAGQVANAARIF